MSNNEVMNVFFTREVLYRDDGIIRAKTHNTPHAASGRAVVCEIARCPASRSNAPAVELKY